jgi:hypothetical protein
METVPEKTSLVREETPVFDRMFAAVEKVKERLDRSCAALDKANIPYAIIGGHAVAAWVATVDDGAVRNTRDVDLLLREEDLDRAAVAMAAAGFVRGEVMNVLLFLDGEDGKPSQGVHVLLAGRKVKESYTTATPTVDQFQTIDNKRVVELKELVRMKLNSFRRKDQTHLLDMIGVGLIDESWPAKYPNPLRQRLQELLDDPDG